MFIERYRSMQPEVQQQYPSWKETAPTLTTDQRIAAEIAFSQKFLKAFIQNAKNQLPWLQRINPDINGFYQGETNREIQARHVAGLLDAYDDIQGGRGLEKVLQWGESKYYLLGQVKSMLPELMVEKDKIFSHAKTWDEKEKDKVIRDTKKFFRKLPREQRIFLEERTGVSKRKLQEELKKWGITISANAASFGIYEVYPTAVGTGLSQTPLPEVFNTPTIIAFLVGSYGAWGVGLEKSVKANNKLLEETGTSTSAPSKFLYDTTKAKGFSERIQGVAAATGYVSLEAMKEIPYYGGVTVAVETGVLSFNQALVLLGGANLAAAVYEYGLARGTKKFLAWRRTKRAKT